MKNNSQKKHNNARRPGCLDVWNAFMCDGAIFSENDIPFCPTILTEYPKEIITWDDAKHIYKKESVKDPDFKRNAFVCFYIDDQKFDGIRSSIWLFPHRALNILKHFKGVITPDFSTYQDFPYPLKLYNTYRMRAFGYWIGRNGLEVINNVRWGSEESFIYSYDSIPKNSVVAIGTVGGNPRQLLDRERFEKGLYEMVNQLKPHTIIIYGSANYKCFEQLKGAGIKIISYMGVTCSAFERRKKNE